MAMALVSTITVGSGGASSIEWQNIPQVGKDLLVLYSLRTVDNVISSLIRFQFNSDTGANYSFRRVQGDGASITSSIGSAQNGVLSYAAGATANTNYFGVGSLYISNYTKTSAKSTSVDAIVENTATTGYSVILAADWTGSSEITSVKIIENSSGTIAQHSTASLYVIS